MLAMTTAVADGVVLHPMTAEPFLADLTERQIPAGLAAAGRDAGGFEVVAGALVGVHDDHDDPSTVRGMLRAMVAFYGSTPAYRPVLDSIDAGALQPDLQALTREGRWGELAAVVPDDVLDQLAVVGPPDDVGHRLRRLYGGRADRLALTFVQPLPPPGLAAVLDRLRE
jgi:alkanesulfonate monooxygenase SsuD/methylene tetrahydromethanopterin reductase-like flavin-dependent oxidoreductase (luciferase family)